MEKFTHAVRSLFAAPARPAVRPRKDLSREEIMALMASRKLSAAQAKAVLTKRFHG